MLKKNEDTVLEKWRRILKFLDIKGGVIIGLFSLEMLALIAYCIVNKQDIPAVMRDIYLGVLTCFAVNQTARVIKGTKDDETTN